jgi:putative hydrolase of the HAD superfamily
MVGNSMRSDIAPVLALGGWGVHMPYHVTWVHETHAPELPDADAARVRTVAAPSGLPQAIASLSRAAAAEPRAASSRNATSTGAAA